jgi:hypothetical protein
LRVDNALIVLNAKQAVTGDVIFPSHNRHFVFLQKRRHVDRQMFDQNLFILAVLFQDDAPLPFAASCFLAIVLYRNQTSSLKAVSS